MPTERRATITHNAFVNLYPCSQKSALPWHHRSGGGDDRLGRRNRDFIKVRTLSYGSPHPCSPCAVFCTFLLKWITSAAVEQTRRSISISDPFNRNRGHAPKNPATSARGADRLICDNQFAEKHTRIQWTEAGPIVRLFFSSSVCCCCQVRPWPTEELERSLRQEAGRKSSRLAWGRDGSLRNGSEMLRRSLACLCKWTSCQPVIWQKKCGWLSEVWTLHTTLHVN